MSLLFMNQPKGNKKRMIEEKEERGKRERHRGDEDRNTNTAMERDMAGEGVKGN